MPTPTTRRPAPTRSIAAACILGTVVFSAACSAEADSRAGLAAIPTRTSPSTSPPPTSGTAIEVSDFTIPPTFACLHDNSSRAIITVGWTAPAATGVEIALDGIRLPAGISDQLPYQVPAGGSTGIGASVVLACNETDRHTVDVTWTAEGTDPVTRTVTITEEHSDG
jgi:hypothetical protein